MLNGLFLEGFRLVYEVHPPSLVPYTKQAQKSYLYEDRYMFFVFPLTNLSNHALNGYSYCIHRLAKPHHRQAPQIHEPLHRVIV